MTSRCAIVSVFASAGLAAVAATAQLALELTPILTGLAQPLAVVDAGDGSGRWFVALQGGEILVWNGVDPPTTFLDLSGEITCCAERGLLGLAFHPDYPADDRFFVFYTADGDPPDELGDLVVASYAVSAGDPDVANAGSGQVLLAIEHSSQSNHNGGHLLFGPDGYLYVGVGDGGGLDDPDGNGQDPDTLLGAVLRIDVDDADGGLQYAIPDGNPFAENAGADEIWNYGLRNPWRFSFDRATGDLWIGDVGQGAVEEIDFDPAATGGFNYGWDVMEGDQCFEPPSGCDTTGLTLPRLTYAHEPGDCGGSVTGGYRYRGDLHPQLRGVYLYADFCRGQLRGTVPRCDGAWEGVTLLETGLNPSSFGEDAAGELVMLHFGGTLYRIGLAAGSGGPLISVQGTTASWGAVPVNTLVSREVSLQNANFGAEAAQVADLGLANGAAFAVDPAGGATPCGTTTPCLGPGEHCTVTVSFSSAVEGGFADTLEIGGNFPAVSIPIDGVAYDGCSHPDTETLIGAVSGEETFSACNEILAADASDPFVVESSGIARLRAGNRVVLRNGVDVAGDLSIEVDPAIALE